MTGGGAIWLVSGVASIAAHVGLVAALSGLTLQTAPPALAELYIGDGDEAPREIEALTEQALAPLEAEIAVVEQLASETSGQVAAVADTLSPPMAEAVMPAEVKSADPGPLEPRASPLAESEVQAGRLSPAADAPAQSSASAQPVEPALAGSPDIEPERQADPPDSPEIATPASEPRKSAVAEREAAPPQLDPAAESGSAAPADAAPAEVPLAARDAPAEIEAPAIVAASPDTVTVQAEPAPARKAVSDVAAPPQVPQPAVQSSPALAGSATTAASPIDSSAAKTAASSASQPQGSRVIAAEDNRQMAALPPVAELPMTRRERIGRFLRGYKGGKCFFARAALLDPDRPRLDGFVTEAGAIPEISNAFRRDVGVEPEMAMRRVMEAQCPAVEFIGKLLRKRVKPMALRLDSDVVRSTDPLVGRIRGENWPYTLLFIVDDDGIVHNLTGDLRPAVGGQSFAAEIHPTAQGRSRNQLILAVGSTAPIDVPSDKRLGEAAPFLARLQALSAEAGGTLALGYETFRVE